MCMRASVCVCVYVCTCKCTEHLPGGGGSTSRGEEREDHEAQHC